MTTLAAGGKIWTPKKPLRPNGLSFGDFSVIALVSMGILSVIVWSVFLHSAISNANAGGFSQLYNPGSTTLIAHFDETSQNYFIKAAIVASVLTIIAGVAGIIFFNVLNKRKSLGSRLSYSVIIAAGVIVATSIAAFSGFNLAPTGHSLLKEKLVSSIQDWGKKNDLNISKSEATKLANTVWGKDDPKNHDLIPAQHNITVDGKSVGVDVTLVLRGHAWFWLSNKEKK
jgi:hypothetical protein